MQARLDQRFAIEARIGHGGVGVVYRARDLERGGLVALKTLRRTDELAARRFELEARLLAGLRHDAIVGYVTHGVLADGSACLVMEWLAGCDLRERLLAGPLALADALHVGARVAEGLAAAHAGGVVHRDVKPSNVFLRADDAAQATLIDFGVARIAGLSQGLTSTGQLVGTPAYMAPEQVRGETLIDARTDLYALGALLFEMLTGSPPFRAASRVALFSKILLDEVPRVATLRPDVPAALDELVAQLLTRDRAQRTSDSARVAAALRALAEGRVPEPLTAVARAPGVIGDEEGHLVCVVLASPAEPTGDLAWGGGTLGPDATAMPPSAGPDLAALGAAAARHGARLERLIDGSVATLLEAGGTAATDLAARGARWADTLRELLPEARLAMAMAVAPAAGTRPLGLGAIIETVAALVALPAGAAVRLDPVAAGLLVDGWERNHDAHSTLLGPRRAEVGREVLGRATRFVGRGRELRRAQALSTRALGEGHALALLVVGAAGSGKSRLVAELLAAPPIDTALVWRGRGDSLRRGTPYGLVALALRAAARLDDGLGVEVARARLAALADAVPDGERARVVDFLGVIAGLPPAAGESAQLVAARSSPQLMADQLQRAFAELVVATATRRPLVLVLEDLHWADGASIELVEAARRAAPATPFLVVAVARPELDARHAAAILGERGGDDDGERLELGELPRAAALALVREVLGDGVTDEQAERLVAQSAGNVLCLEELMRAGELDTGTLPGSVVAMALARLERLPATARRVLRAASVFGESFWAGGVARITGLAAEAVAEELDGLGRAEWVRALPESELAGERQLVFRHGLFREAAYASLIEADAQRGHAGAAAWLGERAAPDPALLALHLERGGDPPRAARAHVRAAQLALAGSDLEGALAHAEHAERLGAGREDLGEALLTRAQALHWRADHVGERRAALGALGRLPPVSASWFRAADLLSEASLPLGDVATLEALAAVVAPPPATLDAPAEVAHACFITAASLAMQLALAGRGAVAAETQRRLDEWLASAGEPPALVRARVEFAQATWAMLGGDLGAVVEHARTAVRHWEAAGDRRNAAHMNANLGWAFSEMGAWPLAEATLREVAAVAERMRLGFLAALWRSNLGWVLGRRGRLDEARALEREAVALYHGIGNQRHEGQSRIYLALIECAAGDVVVAEREARAAVAVTAPLPPTQCFALAALAQVLVAAARPAEAAAAAAESAAIFASLGSIDEGEALVRLVRVETLHLSGDRAGAAAAAEVALGALEARAAKISDPTWRKSFLERVPENVRTRELAGSLGVRPAAS